MRTCLDHKFLFHLPTPSITTPSPPYLTSHILLFTSHLILVTSSQNAIDRINSPFLFSQFPLLCLPSPAHPTGFSYCNFTPAIFNVATSQQQIFVNNFFVSRTLLMRIIGRKYNNIFSCDGVDKSVQHPTAG